MNVAYNLWLICTKKICIRHTHEQAWIEIKTCILCSDDVYCRAYCLGCNRWVRVSDDWLALFIMRYIMSCITLTAGDLNISHNIATCMKASTALIVYYVRGYLYTSINLNWGHIFSIAQCSKIRMYLNGTWNQAIFMFYFISTKIYK